MLRLTTWVLAAVVAAAVSTGEGEPVKRLSAKEAAQGWLLLFDGATTFGWHITGEAKIEDGCLVLGGTTATTAKTTSRFPNGISQVIIESRYQGSKPPTIAITDDFKPESSDSHLFAYESFHPGGSSVVDSPAVAAPWTIEVPAGTKFWLRDARLRPLGSKPLFNGKDLTGWRVYPGRQSRFSVTPQGWLHVRGGPGDLQTIGQWADFFLQLDCFVNGDHLNSGIFFRCIPGQYQQGYEAQIRNQWQSGDRSRPVDYGTGGIYRRQAARRVVSSDRQWFTMTILAHGNHIATWVNGYQVTDWTDHRPPSSNPRRGCKTGSGAISIQGHDPTTDLSFRNIRLVPLRSDSGNDGMK